MSMFEEGFKLLEEMFGNLKNNLISLGLSHGNQAKMENLVLLFGAWMPTMKMARFML